MNNKTKGAIAGIAGIALLAGGTTFSLWNDNAATAGGTITSGNLDVASVGENTWLDISADRTDKGVNGQSINLSTFKIVPGDTIQGTFGIDAALEGDNMVANLGLTLNGLAAEGSLLADSNVMTVTYSLVDTTGTPVAGATDIAIGTPATVKLASTDNTGNVAPGLATLPKALDASADYNVVVTAHFKNATDLRDRVQATVDLQQLGVSLTQDRAAGVGGGF